MVIPLLRDYVVAPGTSHCSGTNTFDLTDRLGQLPRLPSRFRHPVCLAFPGFTHKLINQTSIPRPQLQFRSSPRIPRLPRLSTPRCPLGVHRDLLPGNPPQTRSTPPVRLMARQTHRPIHHPRSERFSCRFGIHGSMAVVFGWIYLLFGRWTGCQWTDCFGSSYC